MPKGFRRRAPLFFKDLLLLLGASILQETLETAKRKKLLKRSHMNRVNVDTTVQEKAIAFPTDARLYHKMRRTLVGDAQERGISLRINAMLAGCGFNMRKLMKAFLSLILRWLFSIKNRNPSILPNAIL
jgi:hypothetical protein